jgi:hypothetical protein
MGESSGNPMGQHDNRRIQSQVSVLIVCWCSLRFSMSSLTAGRPEEEKLDMVAASAVVTRSRKSKEHGKVEYRVKAEDGVSSWVQASQIPLLSLRAFKHK